VRRHGARARQMKARRDVLVYQTIRLGHLHAQAKGARADILQFVKMNPGIVAFLPYVYIPRRK
jgi:hypothetical protein